MVYDLINEFQSVTKFNLVKYFEDYSDFMSKDFAYLSSYYAGAISSVDVKILTNFNNLKSSGKILLQQFINFSSKLSNCGFCELQQYCQDLYDTLERIEKLPKYNRVAKSVRGYQPYVQVDGEIGGMKTVEDLASEMDSSGVSELSLILENDLSEDDWEIDKLSYIQSQVNNQTDVVVDTILEEPIGKMVYGRDMNRKITIKDNDIDVVKYENNVEQKCDILLTLNRGDIPEIPSLGKNIQFGKNNNNYSYAELVKDLRSVFMQDPLFESINVESVDDIEGDLNVKCAIKTKYSYKTVKSIKI